MKTRPFFMRIARTVHDITLSREALVFSVLFTALTLVWLSPATKLRFYQSLLAEITQDRVLAEVNPHRATIGVQPLVVSQKLTDAARMKADDMLARDYFSHVSPEGEKPWVWYSRVRYQFAAAGENLAIDFSDPEPLVNAWLASPTHAANIENGTFTDIGLGIASGEFQGRDTAVVVMFLGKPLSGTLATAAPQTSQAGPQPTPPPQPASQPSPAPQPTAPAAVQPPQAEQSPPPETSGPQLPAQESSPESQPTPAQSALGQSDPTSPLATDNVPPQETFITVKGPESGPLATNAPVPLRTSLLEFLLLKAVFAFRWLLSATFGTTMAASAALYAAPAHRKLVNRSGFVTIGLLLGLLWLPALI